MVVALLTIVVAIVLPEAKWASSGSIKIPVRVFVFDASRGKPIADSRVVIFRAPPLLSERSLAESRELYDPENVERAPITMQGATGDDGMAVIEVEFRTGASHNRPTPYAHLRWGWVYVHADGYGAVVVPVRYESEPMAAVRQQKEFSVSIGLVPI